MPPSDAKPSSPPFRHQTPWWKDPDLWKIWGPVAALTLLGFVAAGLSVKPPAPKSFRLCAGPPGGAYLEFAKRYAAQIESDGFTLEIVETAGSVENLRLLLDGACGAAFLQGGVSKAVDDEPAFQSEPSPVESLASLYREPVWIFYRRGLAPTTLASFTGHRLAIGAEGSGARLLAEQLLQQNGVTPDSATFVDLPETDQAAALASGAADAVFLVASETSPIVRKLLHADGVDLLSVRRDLAYQTRFRYLSSAVLGEGAVDLQKNIPARDIKLLTAAANLVARSDLHPDHVALLLDAAKRIHDSGGMFDEPKEFPSTLYTEFPMREEARRYLDSGPTFLHRYLPFRIAAAADRLKILVLPLITLLIPLFRVAPPIYRWRIRSKIYRWYDELRALDIQQKTDAQEAPASETLEWLDRLEREVNEIKVPLAYMDDFYHLRAHIALVRAKLSVSGPHEAA